ncbi:MAG: hypothetical protein RI955_556 [Bacteroidota bacterium]|jgi:DNA-binding NarL/FixJ family response regulator
MNDVIKIMLADDHQLILDELKKLFMNPKQFEIIGLYNNGTDLKQAIKNNQPDLIITDINMPGINGIEICEWTKMAFPKIKVVLISMFYSPSLIYKLTQIKADGYLIKNTTRLEIEHCVEQVLKGKTIIYQKPLVENIATESFLFPTNYLSDTEKNVLKFIALGFSNKEIADKILMAEFSIESIRKIIYKKLNTGSFADLVSFAVSLGLISNE